MGNKCCSDDNVNRNDVENRMREQIPFPTEPIYAICLLQSSPSNEVHGRVYFKQSGNKCKIRVEISGLSKGKHGFHIHEYGNLKEGCKSAGAHFNPTNQTHGGPHSLKRHVGDLGNIDTEQKQQNKEDVVIYEIEDHLVALYGENNVIGRSCVVHQDEDDLGLGKFDDSLTTGHAGQRVACGTIGLTQKFDFEF